MVIGQRNQSKGRWDKGTNQKDDTTKEQPILTIAQAFGRKNHFGGGLD